MAKKMAKGQFDLEDLAGQLRQMKKLGGLGGLMDLMPGVQKAKAQMASANINDKMLARQEAIIMSMTPQERRKPDILAASRKRRIAAGAGVDVAEVNKVLKMHRAMADMMKKVGKGGAKGLAAALGGMMGGGAPAGPGAQVNQAAIKGLQNMGGVAGAPKLPGLGGGGLPGLGGGLPGLGGDKKK
jgi:signal recognition particle subunit SRP54